MRAILDIADRSLVYENNTYIFHQPCHCIQYHEITNYLLLSVSVEVLSFKLLVVLSVYHGHE